MRNAGSKICLSIALIGLAMMAAGCVRTTFDVNRATQPYPRELHNTRTLDVQVFREGEDIRIVNTSPVSFSNVRLWLNQRFMREIESLPAGETIRLSLWEFFDERGEVYNAGGFFAAFDPLPLRLCQIQVDDTTPLIGLITIRSEPAS
ncbi:MAG: hypothetical protein AAF432_09080 [Planctomycetota bacterium]